MDSNRRHFVTKVAAGLVGVSFFNLFFLRKSYAESPIKNLSFKKSSIFPPGSIVISQTSGGPCAPPGATSGFCVGPGNYCSYICKGGVWNETCDFDPFCC